MNGRPEVTLLFHRRQSTPMKIEQIVIACYHRDIFHLRTCVASVRYWYPQAPITLLKDETRRPFSTRELESSFGVSVQRVPGNIGGWGWTKLDPFLQPTRSRILVLDADTVFLGRVLHVLETYRDDYIVTGILEPDPHARLVIQHYLDVDRIREFDPEYRYPGFCFNTGQMVITTGLLGNGELDKVVDIGSGPRVKFPEALRYTDQGVLNYLLHRASQDGRASVRYLDFWRWPGTPDDGETTVEKLRRREGIPAIMHWAGIKPTRHRDYHRRDVLDFYTHFYYEQVSRGRLKKPVRLIGRSLMTQARLARQRLLGKRLNRGTAAA